jgi:hypothetical protein
MPEKTITDLEKDINLLKESSDKKDADIKILFEKIKESQALIQKIKDKLNSIAQTYHIKINWDK